jgi:pimeloyl-ACP methyl ester carboxylesterase
MSAGFAEGHVEAEARRIRYLEAGRGAALVHLSGPGGLRLTPAHDLLARHFRVVLLDVPQLDRSAEPVSTTLATAIRRMGAVTFNLLGTSSGSTAALALALEEPQRVSALVLESPTVLRAEASNGEVEPRLGALAMPTLVLLGTADAEVPAAMGRVYKERIASCHLVLVYAAGHAISADRPEAFAEVVVDFLERREAFVISRERTVIHP